MTARRFKYETRWSCRMGLWARFVMWGVVRGGAGFVKGGPGSAGMERDGVCRAGVWRGSVSRAGLGTRGK
jgi:hypothetical protein